MSVQTYPKVLLLPLLPTPSLCDASLQVPCKMRQLTRVPSRSPPTLFITSRHVNDLNVQAEAAQLRTQVGGLAKKLAAMEASQEGAKAAAAASQELGRCQAELMELQAAYNKVGKSLDFMCAEMGSCCVMCRSGGEERLLAKNSVSFCIVCWYTDFSVPVMSTHMCP